jgi:hypothetical protein
MSHWSDELLGWWDDVRVWMAFGIAPLAVPVIMSIDAGFGGTPQSAIAVIAIFSLMLSYFGTLLFGLPLYLLLRVYKLTEFWLAPVAGFVAGFILMYLANSWLGLPLMSVAGPSGAAVGALLWLIARPDRQAQAAQAVADEKSPDLNPPRPASRP